MSVAAVKRSTKRARSAQARAERRDEILDAAEGLFTERRFAELHMVRLAKEIGLAKGTLYLYFPSKESLFLAVVRRLLSAWFAAVGERLSRRAFIDADELALELTETFVERPRLTRLLALLHTVLERNIREEDAFEFNAFLARRMSRTGIELERLIPTLEPGQGARLLLHVHALVAGLRQASDPSPAVQRALDRPELRHLQMNFQVELRTALSALFRGFGDALQAQGTSDRATR